MGVIEQEWQNLLLLTLSFCLTVPYTIIIDFLAQF